MYIMMINKIPSPPGTESNVSHFWACCGKQPTLEGSCRRYPPYLPMHQISVNKIKSRRHSSGVSDVIVAGLVTS